MNTSNKNKILFVGFTYDYELLDIDSLSEKFVVKRFYIPNRVNFFLSKICLSKKIYNFLLSILLNLKLFVLSRYNGKFDLIVTKDNIDYFHALNNVKLKKILILRNIVTDKVLDKIECLDFDGVYSFDKSDCDKYGFIHYQQYSSCIYINNVIDTEPSFDVSFVGRDKGRSNLVKEFENKFNKITVNKFILKDVGFFRKVINNLFPYLDNSLNYIEYLKENYKGKAVLDIVQSGQSGITMRMIEALSYKRKVITNNVTVLNHELYHKKNVLYFSTLEDLNYSDIVDFLNDDFFCYSVGYISKYEPCRVIGNIIEENIK